jgi:hypothetical protein
METTLINAGLSLIEALVANYPALAADIQSIFSGGAPTAAQWAALRAQVAAGNYTTQPTPAS